MSDGSDEKLQGMEEELDTWRTRLDQLIVKANLGRMELRDKLHDLGELLDPAHQRAKQILSDAAHAGTEEAKNLARSLNAGWEELVRTHRQASAEASQEKAAEHDKKRHT